MENPRVGLFHTDLLRNGQGLEIRLHARAAQFGVLHLLETVCDEMQVVFRLQIIQQFHRPGNEPDNAWRPVDIVLAEVVGQLNVVDAIMLQRLQKAGAVEVVFGDFVLAI